MMKKLSTKEKEMSQRHPLVANLSPQELLLFFYPENTEEEE